MNAFLQGDIDAAQAMTYNEYAQLLETVNPETGELYQPEDFSVINLQDEGYASLEDGIYAQDSWLAEGENADIATRFLAASYMGWIDCREDGDACVDMVLQRGSALGTSHQAWMMNEVNALIWPSTNGIGRMDEAAWDRTVQGAIEGDGLAGFLESPRLLIEGWTSA